MIISALARESGCQVETIRYYEREGLLPPPERSTGNYRLYRQHHVDRLRFILHCRTLDMTLDEIRSLLGFRDHPEENCGEVNALLERHIDHVARRIGELQALERQLRELRGRCQEVQAVRDCRILQGMGGGSH
ncbi:Cd(II)/Pb(II)-responsive transcriptional regulator [Janthinobacterium sp. 17J80-10]|nr:Cd(II)/Pb(II)-responsive transcriptional regulator [Janthinobacterium sp. 17J80-10]